MTRSPASEDERRTLGSHALTWLLGFGFGVILTLVVVLGSSS